MTPLLNLIWSINSNVNYRSVDMGQAKSECLIVMIGIGVLYTNLKKCPLAYGPSLICITPPNLPYPRIVHCYAQQGLRLFSFFYFFS